MSVRGDDLETSSYVEAIEHRTEKSLLIDNFQDWYRILTLDDVMAYDTHKAMYGEQAMKSFINNKFIYNDHNNLTPSGTVFTIPLIMAACSGSVGVLKRLLEDGADTTASEKFDWNVLHCLIRTVAEELKPEDDLLKSLEIILEHVSAETRYRLIMSTDGDNFKPIELSAKLGTYGIFKRLLNSDAYAKKCDVIGLRRYVEYDVTEYENFEDYARELRSPLRMLLYVTIGQTATLERYRILEMPVIQQWVKRKTLQNVPYLFFWFIIRFLILVAMLALQPVAMVEKNWLFYKALWPNVTSVNGTIQCSGMPIVAEYEGFLDLTLEMIDVFFIFVIVDIVEIVYRLCHRDFRTVRSVRVKNTDRSNYLVKTHFYRVNQFILYFVSQVGKFAITHGGAGLIPLVINPDKYNTCSGLFHEAAAYLFRALKALYLPFVLFSILYLTEWLPFIGTFSIDLRCMMAVMIKFSTLTFFVQCIYVTYVVTVKEMAVYKSLDAFYKVFLVQIGTSDFNGPKPALDIRFVHVIYYYTASVLLVNYLIAIMTSHASRSNGQKMHMQQLRRLDAAFLAEDRFGRWAQKAYRMITKRQSGDVRICVIDP